MNRYSSCQNFLSIASLPQERRHWAVSFFPLDQAILKSSETKDIGY